MNKQLQTANTVIHTAGDPCTMKFLLSITPKCITAQVQTKMYYRCVNGFGLLLAFLKFILYERQAHSQYTPDLYNKVICILMSLRLWFPILQVPSFVCKDNDELGFLF